MQSIPIAVLTVAMGHNQAKPHSFWKCSRNNAIKLQDFHKISLKTEQLSNMSHLHKVETDGEERIFQILANTNQVAENILTSMNHFSYCLPFPDYFELRFPFN